MFKINTDKNIVRRTKASICSALLLCAVSQGLLSNQSALAIGMPAASKHTQMLSPTYEKLFQGSGPATNDNNIQNEKTLDSSDSAGADTASSADLSPLTLTDTAQASKTVDSSDNNSSVLKSTVSTTDYLPHNSDPKIMQAQSIKGDRKHKNNKLDQGTIIDQATAVKVGPLPLLETDSETQKKVGTILDSEKLQLADLWEATLTRSPDIQFVVQKLQPTSNQAHLTNVLAKMLSTVAFGGLGAMSMMSPSMGTFAAASMGGSMVQTALGITQSRADKRAKLSQEEEMMMYNMVRTTCDKLVSFYRDYKKCSSSLNRAADDLQDLQNMVSEAKSGQDAAKQLEMEYTLRKQQRDMDTVADDLQHHRQNLVDLAGGEAVAHLDKQLVDERERLKQLAGDNSTNTIKNTLEDVSIEKGKTQTASRPSPQS